MRLSGAAPRPQRRAFHQPAGRENAASFTELATITGLVCQVTAKALLISSERFNPPVWIPFFRMDPSSKVRAMRAERAKDISIQVDLQWALAERLV